MYEGVEFSNPVAATQSSGSGSGTSVDTAMRRAVQTSPVGVPSGPGFFERIGRFIVHLPTNIYYLILLIGCALGLISKYALDRFRRANFNLLAFATSKTPILQKLAAPPEPAPAPAPIKEPAHNSPQGEDPPADPDPVNIIPIKPPENWGSCIGIKLKLERVCTEEGAIAALRSLRTPEMLNQLKQLNVLNDNLKMAALITIASGSPDQIMQNYETDPRSFVQEVDATVLTIAQSRKAVVDPAKANNVQLLHMSRETFIKLMAKAEAWHFDGKIGNFPEELAAVQRFVETWFDEIAEVNFNADRKLTRDYKQHFRVIAEDDTMLQKIQKNHMLSLRIGVEDPYLVLIEHQIRETRKEFTDLSLTIYKKFQENGPAGQQAADIYCTFRRQLPEPNPDLITVMPLRLDTFWCQYPTEKFWLHLFTPRPSESPKQTADRVVEFLNTHPRPDSHSTNFLQHLVFAPCAKQILLNDIDFIDDVCEKNSQDFWNSLQSILNNPAIPMDERMELWRQLLEPINDSQAWIDAGPHMGKNERAPATICEADYTQLTEQINPYGLMVNFSFAQDVYVQTRILDFAFCIAKNDNAISPKMITPYLITYNRAQPKIIPAP